MPSAPFAAPLVFRGRILVEAFWFSNALYTEDIVRARVFSLWQSGAKLEKYAQGWLLHLPHPLSILASESPAAPLCRVLGALVSAPFDPKKWKPAMGETWIVGDGHWQQLTGGETFDLALWLNVGEWHIEAPHSLGELPVIEAAIQPLETDLRVAAGLAPVDASLTQFLANWQQQKDGQTPTGYMGKPNPFLDSIARFLSPNRATNAPLASSVSIVVSSFLALGAAISFYFGAHFSPEKTASSALITAVLLIVSSVAWATLRGFVGAPTVEVSPFILPSTVRNIVFAIFLLGLLSIANFNRELALGLLVCLIVLWLAMRALGFVGHLVGRGAGAVASVGATAGTGGFLGAMGAMLSGLGTGGALGGMAGGLGAAGLLSRLFKRGSAGQGQGGGQPKPKTQDDARDALKRLLANAAFWSGLARTLGRQQARYMMKMMEMFERGDFENALKHAIPLGGEGDSNWSPPPSLGLPSPRGDLSISPYQMAAKGSLNFGPEVQQRLQDLYRCAFERLRDQGKWREAAFILAELLNNSNEAVQFLQEKGEWKLAAQIAEARDLEPGLVVRAWWLAGDKSRAIAIARQKNAFAPALALLERDELRRVDAIALRLMWGDFLAQIGNYATAIEVVWQLERGKELAHKWLRLGLQNGDTPRLLARAISLEPENWSEWQPRVQEFLESNEDDATASLQRRQFATILAELGDKKSGVAKLDESNARVVGIAARATVRALIRDADNLAIAWNKSLQNDLLRLGGDGALRSDANFSPTIGTPNSEVFSMAWRESDVGAVPVLDVALLPDGGALLALGEMGARLVGREGQTRAHFDQSAHHLVISDYGDRALLLAPRDEVWRVSKLDLPTRTARHWAEIERGVFANSFDGQRWFIAQKKRVMALDCLGEAPQKLTDSGDTDGSITQIARESTSLSAIIHRQLIQASQDTPSRVMTDRWQFQLPEFTLRLRGEEQRFVESMVPSDAGKTLIVTSPYGIMTMATLRYYDEYQTDLRLYCNGNEISIPSACQTVHSVLFGHKIAILWRDFKGACQITVCATDSLRVEATLTFAMPADVHCELRGRWCGSQLVIFDDGGRVVVYEANSRKITRDWRVF